MSIVIIPTIVNFHRIFLELGYSGKEGSGPALQAQKKHGACESRAFVTSVMLISDGFLYFFLIDRISSVLKRLFGLQFAAAVFTQSGKDQIVAGDLAFKICFWIL